MTKKYKENNNSMSTNMKISIRNLTYLYNLHIDNIFYITVVSGFFYYTTNQKIQPPET